MFGPSSTSLVCNLAHRHRGPRETAIAFEMVLRVSCQSSSLDIPFKSKGRYHGSPGSCLRDRVYVCSLVLIIAITLPSVACLRLLLVRRNLDTREKEHQAGRTGSEVAQTSLRVPQWVSK